MTEAVRDRDVSRDLDELKRMSHEHRRILLAVAKKVHVDADELRVR